MPDRIAVTIATSTIVVLAVLTAACDRPAADVDPSIVPEAMANDSVTPSGTPLAARAGPDTSPEDGSSLGWTAGVVHSQQAIAGVVTAVATRTASHDGYDRFVIEMDGSELPSYHAEYVDRPVRQCGSGEPVEIAGDGWLRVRLEPAQAHDEEGRPTIEDRDRRPDLQNLLQIRLICDFEGQVEWVLGVASPNPFRVLDLANPTRLVIDVRH